jgi:UDP-glucose 4-epimerase
MSKILVTGGAGFVGSHVVDFYVKEGHEVIILDKQLPRHKNLKATYYLKDLSTIETGDLLSILDGVEVVNHHAAQVDVRKSISNPFYDANENISNTLKLLQCCVASSNVKRFIFASSGGAIAGSEFPSSPYGISKLTIEKYLHFFKEHYKLDNVILRYSNLYGPRQQGGVIPIFARKLLNNEAITINGGDQLRDFAFIEDVAKLNNIALVVDPGLYNVCSNKSYSIKEVAQIMKDICPNSTSIIQYNPYISGEVMHSNLQSDVGWDSKTPLQEGLEKTIEYWK